MISPPGNSEVADAGGRRHSWRLELTCFAQEINRYDNVQTPNSNGASCPSSVGE